jgi:phasin family protein
MNSFEDFQKFSKDGVDATMQSLNAASKGMQAIAAEATEYARKSFEETTAATEKLFGARTIERAIEVQSDYAKRAYEGYIAQATKVGEIFTDAARESYKSFEGYATKFKPAA